VRYGEIFIQIFISEVNEFVNTLFHVVTCWKYVPYHKVFIKVPELFLEQRT